MSALLDFYRGCGTDGVGRGLADVWAFSDREMEWHHDFIQWLFPLTERSRYNPAAPVLTSEDIEAFRADPVLQERLRISFRRFVQFLGLDYDGRTVLEPASGRGLDLFRNPNHNWLRITRVLRSLRVLGLNAEAEAFFSTLEALYERGIGITDETFEYWADAAG